MKLLLTCLLLLAGGLNSQQGLLQPPVNRMNIQYGNSKCHDWHKIFDIPKNFPAVGLRLYAQGGFETHIGIEGFSRGVEFVIQ